MFVHAHTHVHCHIDRLKERGKKMGVGKRNKQKENDQIYRMFIK